MPEAAAAQVENGATGPTQTVTSPDGRLSVTVDVSSGEATYSVSHDGTTVVSESGLGFEFEDQASFATGLRVTGAERTTYDETWEPIWDQYREIREHYTELRVGLTEERGSDARAATASQSTATATPASTRTETETTQSTETPSGTATSTATSTSTPADTTTPTQTSSTTPETTEQAAAATGREAVSGRSLTLVVRVFDDGVGFRYVFPEESGFGDFVVTSERTEFAFTDDHTSWWVGNDFNSYEYAYEETPLSQVGSGTSYDGAHTPFTVRTDEGRYLSVHEASLVDYAAMAVEPGAEPTTFESVLAPLPDGTKVRATAPHRTPWRTIQVGTSPGDLVESNLVVNLNEPYDPSEFPAGTDWIVPEKFMGVWWLMITGRAEWEYRGPRTGNHGAQTGRMKRYMEFASEHGIPSVLVEGWNEGWNSYPGDGSTMDFDDTYPDFDIEAVTSYGQQLDPPVSMTAHNETAGNVSNYERQLTEEDPNPFADYDDLGITSIKTGYVADSGVTIDGTTYNHHCQPLVNHHRLVYREAAKNRQRLEVHEPVKPTGERRTYPNVMTREGVLGQEYDSFGFVSPSHHVTFPFTRMLGGPVEYTPGIFDMDSGSGGIETTRAKQLAMYPTYFSGLHMVADLPSSYLAEQEATVDVGGVAQAEFGERDSLARAARWANAQGGRYVEFDPNTVDPGAAVSWTVEDVENAGEYDVHLRYASDAENNAVRGPRGLPPSASKARPRRR